MARFFETLYLLGWILLAVVDVHTIVLAESGQIEPMKTDAGFTFCDTSAETDESVLQRDRLATKASARGSLEYGTDAAGDMIRRDGMWIVEADETILFKDNLHDLQGNTLRFLPAGGGGYTVNLANEAYDPTLGDQVLGPEDSANSVRIDLANFSFPIGSSSYSTLWVDRRLGIRSTTPTDAPEPLGEREYQVGKTSFSLGGYLLRDPSDRLSPCFHRGTDYSARHVWVRDTGDKLLLTWRLAESDQGQEGHYDIQAALFPDGTVDFVFRTIRPPGNGAPNILYDIPTWLSGFALLGEQDDPDDGHNPRVELLELEFLDDPTSDMVRIRVHTEGPIPSIVFPPVRYEIDLENAGQLAYRFDFVTSPSGRTDLRFYDAASNALVRVGTVVISDTVWDVMASLSELGDLDPGAIELYARTYEAGQPRDEIGLVVQSDGGPGFFRDFNAEAPFSSTAPIIEPFLLPEFNVLGVKRLILDETGWDETRIEAMAMYATFFTEMNLFTSARALVGNSGVSNIGRGDPEQPLSPTLLQMGKILNAWNDPDESMRFTILSHEFGHRWLQDVLIDEGQGPSNVLNPLGSHPAAYVHTEAQRDLVTSNDSSVMGGGYWTDNLNGTFTTPSEQTFFSFSAYELYLLGLMPPEEVADWFYIADTVPPQALEYWPDPDTTVSGVRHDVDINMLLSAMGSRNPAYPDARREFFVPLVAVVRPGQEPTTEEWDFMLSLRDPWRAAFATQTDGRGTATTISTRVVSPPGSPPLLVEKLAEGQLRISFEDPQFGDQVRYNLYEGALGSGFDGYGPHTCGAVPSSSAGRLHLDVTPQSPSSAYFLVTMSNIAFEGSPGEDSSGSPRETTGATCGSW